MVKWGFSIGINTDMAHSEIAQLGVLAPAPQKSMWWNRNETILQLHERGITSDFCWYYWHGTVIAIRMERISRDAGKRRSLFACAVALLLSTWKQNEQRSETVFELGRKKTSNGHRNENVQTGLMLMQPTSTRAWWLLSNDGAYWIPSKNNLHAVHSRIGQHFSVDGVAVCICAD